MSTLPTPGTVVELRAIAVKLVAIVLNIVVMVVLVFIVAAVAWMKVLPTALGYCSHKASMPPTFLKPGKYVNGFEDEVQM